MRSDAQSLKSHASLVGAPIQNGVRFYHATTAAIVAEIDLPGDPRRQVWVLPAHGGRVYFSAGNSNDGAAGAVQFPAGRSLWSCRIGAVDHLAPTAWGDHAALLTRDMRDGRLVCSELVVLGPTGADQARYPDAENAPVGFINDALPARGMGGRLHVAGQTGVLALRRLGSEVVRGVTAAPGSNTSGTSRRS